MSQNFSSKDLRTKTGNDRVVYNEKNKTKITNKSMLFSFKNNGSFNKNQVESLYLNAQKHINQVAVNPKIYVRVMNKQQVFTMKSTNSEFNMDEVDDYYQNRVKDKKKFTEFYTVEIGYSSQEKMKITPKGQRELDRIKADRDERLRIKTEAEKQTIKTKKPMMFKRY
jgi:hypothetical protein